MSSPIKPTFKTEIIPIGLILIAFVASFYFYANFPDQVPTHWNFQGTADNYSNKTFGAFFFPWLILAMYVMFIIFPNLDPKKDRYQQFTKVYHLFKNTLILVMVSIYFISSLIGMGYNLPISILIPGIIGLLFIILGNYMGKIKRNWFMGIRTPWTLSNEEVWNKTHRLGGKIFIAMGVIMLAGSFIPNESLFGLIFIIGVLITALVPIIYSYRLYKKIEKNKQ